MSEKGGGALGGEERHAATRAGRREGDEREGEVWVCPCAPEDELGPVRAGLLLGHLGRAVRLGGHLRPGRRRRRGRSRALLRRQLRRRRRRHVGVRQGLDALLERGDVLPAVGARRLERLEVAEGLLVVAAAVVRLGAAEERLMEGGEGGRRCERAGAGWVDATRRLSGEDGNGAAGKTSRSGGNGDARDGGGTAWGGAPWGGPG